MSKHFFYNYKDELEIKLSKVFRKELKNLEEDRKKLEQLDIAQDMIEKYFTNLENDLIDIIGVSDGKIHTARDGDMFMKFSMYEHFVKFTRFARGIEVEIGVYDDFVGIVEARINSNIIPGEKRCVVKKIGKVHDGSHFDENTINYYMNEAFNALDILKE